MKSEDIQRQVQSLQDTLRKAKDSAMLAPNDPAVAELERIVMRKIEQTEALKAEESKAVLEHIFFAEDDEASESE